MLQPSLVLALSLGRTSGIKSIASPILLYIYHSVMTDMSLHFAYAKGNIFQYGSLFPQKPYIGHEMKYKRHITLKWNSTKQWNEISENDSRRKRRKVRQC